MGVRFVCLWFTLVTDNQAVTRLCILQSSVVLTLGSRSSYASFRIPQQSQNTQQQRRRAHGMTIRLLSGLDKHGDPQSHCIQAVGGSTSTYNPCTTCIHRLRDTRAPYTPSFDSITREFPTSSGSLGRRVSNGTWPSRRARLAAPTLYKIMSSCVSERTKCCQLPLVGCRPSLSCSLSSRQSFARPVFNFPYSLARSFKLRE